MLVGTIPTPEQDRRLRLVVDNGKIIRRPKNYRLYITSEEIRKVMPPRRKRFNWKLLAGNMAMVIFTSLSISVIFWALIVWLTGW